MCEEKLARQKTRMEIAEIRQRIKIQHENRVNEKKTGRKILGFLQAMVTPIAILSSVLVLMLQINGFLLQRQREYEFKLNQELITLVKQLSSKEPYERENAVILLSAFEKDAIPLLFRNLITAAEPTNIIESLKIIDEKKRVKRYLVLDKLRSSADDLFDRNMEVKKFIKAFRNYIIAIGELGEHISEYGDQGEERQQQLLSQLKAWKLKVNKIIKEHSNEFSSYELFPFKENYTDSCIKLGGKSCGY